MKTKRPRITIVGGGSAGWLSAAYLASRLGSSAPERSVEITLIEASDIPPIGVGEATVPSIRNTLASMGVKEYDFMRACDATFKHGIKFQQWRHSPEEKPGENFYHPFQRPIKAGFDSLAGYWLQGLDPHGRKFCEAVSVQPRLSDAGYAPKSFDDPSWSGPLPYAYHLDAGKLANFLRGLAVSKGVQHRVAKVRDVILRGDGGIDSLTLDDGDTISADLFIDCSGFIGLLIDKQLGEPLQSIDDVLFCNRAIACQVPHAHPDQPIRPYTLSTAQSSGWIWDIGLKNRRGTGHVFASDYMSDDQAESILRQYIGPQADDLMFRTLDMKVGYRRRQWIHNCVAVGLSAGFLEPLESTGIHLVELALYALENLLPRYFAGCETQPQFNELMRDQYAISIEFIKLHYCLSQRRDTAFWRDNTAPQSLTSELSDKLQAWRNSYPCVHDIHVVHSVFDHMGYQYIYLGMDRGVNPQPVAVCGYDQQAMAKDIFRTTYDAFERASAVLPPHRELLEKIHRCGVGASPGSVRHAERVENRTE